MIVIPMKEGENIERALKRFKRKFEKTGVIRELRARQAYIKPSVTKREQKKKAVYVQKLRQEGDVGHCSGGYTKMAANYVSGRR